MRKKNGEEVLRNDKVVKVIAFTSTLLPPRDYHVKVDNFWTNLCLNEITLYRYGDRWTEYEFLMVSPRSSKFFCPTSCSLVALPSIKVGFYTMMLQEGRWLQLRSIRTLYEKPLTVDCMYVCIPLIFLLKATGAGQPEVRLLATYDYVDATGRVRCDACCSLDHFYCRYITYIHFLLRQAFALWVGLY